LSDLDAYTMAHAVVDEGVRRVLCAGARLDRLSALDNFCWPDPVVSAKTPDGRHKLAQLVRTCEALYEACVVQKDFEKGRRIMMALLPITTVLERGGKFLQCVKYACELQGLPGGAVRKPMRPLKKELARQMRDALHIAQTTVAAIEAEAARPEGPVLRQVHG